MLAKIDLLVLLIEETTYKVSAYFLNNSQKLLLCKKFKKWDINIIDVCIDLRKMYEQLKQNIILVELNLRLNEAIITSTDINKTLIKNHLSLQIGIIFAQYFEIPLFINQFELQKKGLKVTKQLIEEIV